jgi:hypothetical protein
MFHGGTNIGFQSGADWSTVLTPVTTRWVANEVNDVQGRFILLTKR